MEDYRIKDELLSIYSNLIAEYLIKYNTTNKDEYLKIAKFYRLLYDRLIDSILLTNIFN